MINIDPQKVRERLLPQSGWRAWQKPRDHLSIDGWVYDWVSKKKNKPGDLPAHLDHDACPYWYARSGVVTAVHAADRQLALWSEKQEYIAKTLDDYKAEAAGIIEASQHLRERMSRFLHLYLAINGNMFRHDHYKVADVPAKPELDEIAVRRLSQELAALPVTLKLSEALSATAAARERWVNNQGDVWKNVFVGLLGSVWKDLTKSPPKNADPFKEFVAEAWATIDGDPDESFDWTIVTVTRGFRC
jgi:hypothetical protein